MSKAIVGLLIVALECIAAPALALETCDACKHLACLKDKLQNLSEWIAGYGNLKAQLAVKVPQAFFDLTGMTQPERIAARALVASQSDEYGREVKKMEHDLTMSACGPTGSVTADTDPITCEINQASVDNGRSHAVCRELGERFQAHEDFHRAVCLKRNETTYTVPPDTDKRYGILMTMAGLAAEEMAAHQRDIDAIKPIVDKLQKHCGNFRFPPVSLRCVNVDAPGAHIETEILVTGKVCGDAAGKWRFRNSSVYTEQIKGVSNRVLRRTDPWHDMECVPARGEEDLRQDAIYRAGMEAGNAGGMSCTYEIGEGKLPDITLRNYPIRMCRGAKQEDIHVEVERTERCEPD